MRSNVDSRKIEQLMEALGKEARSSGRGVFVGQRGQIPFYSFSTLKAESPL